MNIVWFSWKDRKHPQAGGAEIVSGEIMDRLVRDGHNVKLITATYQGATATDTMNGIDIVRGGGRLGVYIRAWVYYRKNLRDWADVTIDEMNTLPFMTGFYSRARRKVLLAHQLAREVWFYQMIPPISWLGYALEPLMLSFIKNSYTDKIVVSGSTKTDLEKYGFTDVKTFKVGMAVKPLESLQEKQLSNKLLSHGAVRPMKRTLDIVKAFEYARDTLPDITLDITGDSSGSYGEQVNTYIQSSRHCDAITMHGRVANEARDSLMRQADAILVASVKEGWGLIVTEAASQGTPAVAYNGDGYRDSIDDGKTGILSKEKSPASLGDAIVQLYSQPQQYNPMRIQAWEKSKQYSHEDSYRSFLDALGI